MLALAAPALLALAISQPGVFLPKLALAANSHALFVDMVLHLEEPGAGPGFHRLGQLSDLLVVRDFGGFEVHVITG